MPFNNERVMQNVAIPFKNVAYPKILPAPCTSRARANLTLTSSISGVKAPLILVSACTLTPKLSIGGNTPGRYGVARTESRKWVPLN